MATESLFQQLNKPAENNISVANETLTALTEQDDPEGDDVVDVDGELVELNADTVDIDRDIEQLNAAADTADEIVGAIEAFAAEGGMTRQTATLLRAQLTGLFSTIGMSNEVIALEAFDSEDDRLTSTQAALEGVKEFAKETWEWIKKMIGALVNRVKAIWQKLTVNFKRLINKLYALSEHYGNTAELKKGRTEQKFTGLSGCYTGSKFDVRATINKLKGTSNEIKASCTRITEFCSELAITSCVAPNDHVAKTLKLLSEKAMTIKDVATLPNGVKLGVEVQTKTVRETEIASTIVPVISKFDAKNAGSVTIKLEKTTNDYIQDTRRLILIVEDYKAMNDHVHRLLDNLDRAIKAPLKKPGYKFEMRLARTGAGVISGYMSALSKFQVPLYRCYSDNVKALTKLLSNYK